MSGSFPTTDAEVAAWIAAQQAASSAAAAAATVSASDVSSSTAKPSSGGSGTSKPSGGSSGGSSGSGGGGGIPAAANPTIKLTPTIGDAVAFSLGGLAGLYIYHSIIDEDILDTDGLGMMAKPEREMKPIDAPPGTIPIDKSGLPRATIENAKKQNDLGPRDGTWLTPNGHIIANESGLAVDLGHYSEYENGKQK